MSDQQTIERDIQAAVEEGDHRLAADLWSRLRESRPDNERYWTEQIIALRRGYCWSDANDCGHQALKRFPESIWVALTHAHTAYQSLDWQTAIDRFEALRASFGATKSKEALTTVLDQLFCFDQMAEDNAARALARKYWPQIRQHQFERRNEIFEIGSLIPEADDYEKWSAPALPEAHRIFYARRLAEAKENESWVSKNAPNTLIISLGQNCLPWMLPNRWGLRPGHINMSPKMVFDFFPSVNDITANLVENDFELLLRPEALCTISYPNKLPGLYNTALSAAFFHEKGPWWQRNNWERVLAAYRLRIDNFRRAVRTGERLYVYCVVGANNVDRVVDAYVSHLDDDSARLLIVNVLKEPIPANFTHRHVMVSHIPYPEDYNWMYWLDYNSERGYMFEREVATTLKEELLKIGQD